MTDREIAQWLGVTKSTVGKWRLGQAQVDSGRPRRTPAFQIIAKAIGVDFDPRSAATPRSVVVAFGKAVGYLDEHEAVIEQERSRRWQPKEPTMDPLPDANGRPRKRWYTVHVADEFGVAQTTVNSWIWRQPEFAEPNQDELARNFWYDEQLDVWSRRLKEADQRREEPPPHGYDDEGRPYRYIARVTERADGLDQEGRAYRLLPADSIYVKQAAAGAAQSRGEGREKN